MIKTAAVITAVVGTLRVLSRVFVTAFKTFTEFEFSMAKVRAISGATNEEFIKLTQSAKELGRTTFFTAKEVAELQVNFSKLGFSAEEIINLQGATLDLAMATGSDLARSAMVAGSAVRGFNLDAAEATRVVDVMAVAFTNSALDIEKWQTSMTKVSAIAASIGIDIEGTAAVMGSLSDTGIEASIAGTSLRNIFLKMANPTSALAKRIGFVVNSTDDMIKALKKLKSAQIGQLEMQSLVDVRQVIAMQAMIQNVDTIDRYTVSLRDAEGAGREMSAIMEDSTKGSFKRFQSALEGLYLVLSEKIAPTINSVTKSITKLLGKMSSASETKVSQQWTKDQIAMNQLFEAMNDTNNSLSTREELLRRFNRHYGDYLDNQLEDVTNTEDLAAAQKELNAMFMERISLQVAEEDITEHVRRGKELQSELADVEMKLLAVQAKMGETAGEAIKRRMGEKWEELSELLPDPNDPSFGAFLDLTEVALKKFGSNTTIVFTEMFKDFKETSDLSALIEEQLLLRAEEMERPESLEKLKTAYTKAAGDIDKLLASLSGNKKKGKGQEECPKGQFRDPITQKCVDIVATRNFVQELAEFTVSVKDKASAKFMENEIARAHAILEKKAELAKAEFEMYEETDQRRAGAHLKYLKSLEAVDKSAISMRLTAIEEGFRKEKAILNQQGREKKNFSLVQKQKELELERETLQKKLEAWKGYEKKIKQIQGQLAANEENLKDNSHAQEKEFAQFRVDLAQELANTTFTIMSNNIEREKTAQLEGLNTEYDNAMSYLDMQLTNKQISQADYDGKKLMAETKLKEEETRINKEFARKEKNMARAQAIINGALAVTKAYAQTGVLGTFVVPLIIASTMMQLAVIDSQEFAKGGMIEEFAGGGMVKGKSHAQGGEKFAVGGRVVELEGGEAVINKRSTSMFKGQLSAMNSAGGGVKFADGGLLNSPSFSAARFNSAGFNAASGGSNKVVVVESDITNSQRQVKAIQSNASF